MSDGDISRQRERLAYGLLAEALYDLATLPAGPQSQPRVQRAMAALLGLREVLDAAFTATARTGAARQPVPRR
jgi:hypothetical protein